jgi:hypothetical protein
MKTLFVVSAIALASVSTSAFAELKPNGALEALRCGQTTDFPFSVKVCLSRVNGSKSMYLEITSINSEAFPMPGEVIGEIYKDTTYAKVFKTKSKKGTTTWTATAVGPGERGYTVERTYSLAIDENGVGTLKANGQVMGMSADSIQMEWQAQTRSIE